MIKVTEYFSASRFAKLLKNDILLNYKNYLLTFVVALVVMYALLLFNMVNELRIFDTNEYLTNFIICLVGLGAYVGSAFPAFNSSKTTRTYLLTPGTTLEKYILQIFLRIIVGVIVFMFSFWAMSYLARFTALHFESVKASGVFIDTFSFSKFVEDLQYHNDLNYQLLLFFVAFIIGIFLFVMRLCFTRFAILKSVILGVFLLFILLTTLVALSHIFFPMETKGFDVATSLYNTNTFGIGNFIRASVIIMCVFMLPFGYFKLKEKQV